MKLRSIILTIGACALLLLGVAPVWGAKGGVPGKPPPNDEGDPPAMDYPFYFWRLGHMDGPHDSAKALGISRDGKVAVGSTVVVEFTKAWRMDIDWALSTEDDGQPPLYNELQVQESIGGEAAYTASDMTVTDCPYDKVAENLDWCGSLPVGTLMTGTVSYGAEWLWAYDAEAVDPNYVAIPDFGGGISDMAVNDVSADGFILVGTGNTKTGMKAFRADTTVVDEDLVPIPVQLAIQDAVTLQTLQYSSAEAVSADGLIIAGYGGTKQGNRPFVTTSEDWSADEPVLVSTILPMIPGGKFAEAYAMTETDEGVIYIAGRSDSPKGPQACIWFVDETTGEWVVKGLGGLSKKKLDSVATGIIQRPETTDGELMVVGYSQSILYPSEAFVWAGNPVLEDDGIGYMYDLEYILIKTGAAEASSMGSSWILNQATGVALNEDDTEDDTARIVGWGVNPEGGIEAWLAAGFPLDGVIEDLFIKE